MGAFSASERTLDAMPLAPPPRTGAAPSVLPAATQRGVLVVTDLTPAGTNAAWRGALVARDRGLPVVLISHNMNDVIAVADRVVALFLGRVAAEVLTRDTSVAQIVELITSGRSGDLGLAPAAANEGI